MFQRDTSVRPALLLVLTLIEIGRIAIADDFSQDFRDRHIRDEEGKYKHEAQTFPAPASTAVMKMERQNGQVSYHVSEEDQAFRELVRFPFTTEPILVAQVYGQRGGESNVLDIRITNLEVDAETFVRSGETPREQSLSIQWLSAWIIVGLTVVSTATCWYRRHDA